MRQWNTWDKRFWNPWWPLALDSAQKFNRNIKNTMLHQPKVRNVENANRGVEMWTASVELSKAPTEWPKAPTKVENVLWSRVFLMSILLERRSTCLIVHCTCSHHWARHQLTEQRNGRSDYREMHVHNVQRSIRISETFENFWHGYHFFLECDRKSLHVNVNVHFWNVNVNVHFWNVTEKKWRA